MNKTMNFYLDYIQPVVYTEEQMFLEANRLINEGIISLDKIKNITSKVLPKLLKVLKKFGVNLSPIKNTSKSITKILKNNFEKKSNPEDTAKAIQKAIIFNAKKSFKNIPIEEKIALSLIGGLIMVYIAVILNTAFLDLFILLGIEGADTISGCIIAPLVEEAAKALMIHGLPEAALGSTAVFAGIEALDYLIKGASLGVNLPKLILLKGIGVIYHIITAVVQKYFKGKDTDNSHTFTIIGFCIAVMMHAAFNITVTVFNNGLTKFLFT